MFYTIARWFTAIVLGLYTGAISFAFGLAIAEFIVRNL